MDSEKIDALGAELNSLVNCLGGGKGVNALADKMLFTHPTLNQSFTGGFIIYFVREMANRFKNGNYDGRNKIACAMCNSMWEGLKTDFPFFKDYENIELPLI